MNQLAAVLSRKSYLAIVLATPHGAAAASFVYPVLAPLFLGCLLGFGTGFLLLGTARPGHEDGSLDVYAALDALAHPLALSRALRNSTVVRMLQRQERQRQRLAEELARKVHVLCCLDGNVPARLASYTWLRRCNRRHSSGSRADALRHLYRHERHSAHWFLLAEARTYVIIENLRYVVRNLDPSQPYVLGHATSTTGSEPLLDSDFVLVLSRGALQRLGQGDCPEQLSRCIQRIRLLDGRDRAGCRRFFPDSLLTASPSLLDTKPPCLSRTVIAIHEPSVRAVALLEYGSRSLRPYGVAGYAGRHPQDDIDDDDDRIAINNKLTERAF